MTMMGRAMATKRRLRPRYFQIFFIALVMMYKSGPFREDPLPVFGTFRRYMRRDWNLL